VTLHHASAGALISFKRGEMWPRPETVVVIDGVAGDVCRECLTARLHHDERVAALPLGAASAGELLWDGEP